MLLTNNKRFEICKTYISSNIHRKFSTNLIFSGNILGKKLKFLIQHGLLENDNVHGSRNEYFDFKAAFKYPF